MDPPSTPSGCNVSSISYYFTFHVSDELHRITIFVNENRNVFYSAFPYWKPFSLFRKANIKKKTDWALSLMTSCSTSSNAWLCAVPSKPPPSPGDGGTSRSCSRALSWMLMSSWNALTVVHCVHWWLPSVKQQISCLHRQGSVQDLRLIFYLADPSYLLSIGQAVSNAIESGNIEFLEFNIWPVIRPTRCSDEHLILFGQRFMSFLDACPNVFRWLTSLTLRRMRFGEADIQSILNAWEAEGPFSGLLWIELRFCTEDRCTELPPGGARIRQVLFLTSWVDLCPTASSASLWY